MKNNKSRIIQIAIAATDTDDGKRTETIFALDSTGHIWFWCEESSKKTAGWVSMALPWDRPQKDKSQSRQVTRTFKPLDEMTFKARLKAVASGTPVTPPNPSEKPPF